MYINGWTDFHDFCSIRIRLRQVRNEKNTGNSTVKSDSIFIMKKPKEEFVFLPDFFLNTI